MLGSVSVVTTPTLFNTPEGDAIVAAMQIFPVTNAWNEDISQRPPAGADRFTYRCDFHAS
jgi:hypothetical protein